VEIAKDGQSWRIGTKAQISWIANGTSIYQTITSAIPPVFAAYATFWESDDDSVSMTVYEQAVLSHLIEQTAADQPWWLGYRDPLGSVPRAPALFTGPLSDQRQDSVWVSADPPAGGGNVGGSNRVIEIFAVGAG
jgi:hypothetical protein